MSVDEDVVEVEDGVVVVAVLAGAVDGVVVSAAVVAVLVRVDLLQPATASPRTRVVNKSVFFIGRYELPGD